MQEFNPASSEWDFGSTSTGVWAAILGDPEPQVRVGNFLAMVDNRIATRNAGKFPAGTLTVPCGVSIRATAS